MRDRLLRSSARLALDRPRLVLGLALLLALAAGLLASRRLRMNANTDDLIAPDRPYMQSYRAFIEEFGDLESIFAVIAVPEGRDEEARRAADELAARITAHPELPRPQFRIERDEQMRLAAWNMTDDELQGFTEAGAAIGLIRARPGAQHLAMDAIARSRNISRSVLPRSRRELGGALVLTAQAMTAIIAEGRADRELGELLADAPRYLVSDSGRLLFIEMMPAKDYGTLAVIEEPLRLLRAEIAAVREAHPGLEIGLTGKPVLQADEMATTDRDMTRASVVAVILVALLFMAVIGDVRRPFLAVLTLLIAIAWTFGLTTLVIGQLNLLSVVFTLILVGVGIDFGVHIIARYQEERATHDQAEALHRALLHAGRGNLSGALTTSIAFLMALLTDFRGLQELGFVAGSGIFLCLVAMTTVLPALLVLFDRREGAPGGRRLAASIARLEPRFLLDRPGRWLLVLALVTLLIVPFSRRPGFSGNVLELQATGLDSVHWEHRVLEDSAAASWFGAAIADDLEELDAVVARAAAEADVGEILSVLDFVARPDAARREALGALVTAGATPESAPLPREPLAAATVKELAQALRGLAKLADGRTDEDELQRLEDLALDLARIARGLEQGGEAADRLRERIERKLEDFAEAFDHVIGGAAMDLAPLMPEALRHRLVAPSGRFLASIHPCRDVWDLENMERFVAALRRIDPEVTGVPITHYQSILDMRDGFGRAALYALLAVLLIVGLDFRRPSAVLLAMTPLAVAAAWLLLWMGLADLSFNLANFFSVPILIGIGVDNGIHLLHRFREKGPMRLRFSATHRGVFLTSSTSLIGFGCLAFATHRGLQSLGLVMALGCAACLAASLLALPSVLAIVARRESPPRGGDRASSGP